MNDEQRDRILRSAILWLDAADDMLEDMRDALGEARNGTRLLELHGDAKESMLQLQLTIAESLNGK